jgi:hypothetical protein
VAVVSGDILEAIKHQAQAVGVLCEGWLACDAHPPEVNAGARESWHTTSLARQAQLGHQPQQKSRENPHWLSRALPARLQNWQFRVPHLAQSDTLLVLKTGQQLAGLA